MLLKTITRATVAALLMLGSLVIVEGSANASMASASSGSVAPELRMAPCVWPVGVGWCMKFDPAETKKLAESPTAAHAGIIASAGCAAFVVPQAIAVCTGIVNVNAGILVSKANEALRTGQCVELRINTLSPILSGSNVIPCHG